MINTEDAYYWRVEAERLCVGLTSPLEICNSLAAMAMSERMPVFDLHIDLCDRLYFFVYGCPLPVTPLASVISKCYVDWCRCCVSCMRFVSFCMAFFKSVTISSWFLLSSFSVAFDDAV